MSDVQWSRQAVAFSPWLGNGIEPGAEQGGLAGETRVDFSRVPKDAGVVLLTNKQRADARVGSGVDATARSTPRSGRPNGQMWRAVAAAPGEAA